jgi:hypothetical protein
VCRAFTDEMLHPPRRFRWDSRRDAEARRRTGGQDKKSENSAPLRLRGRILGGALEISADAPVPMGLPQRRGDAEKNRRSGQEIGKLSASASPRENSWRSLGDFEKCPFCQCSQKIPMGWLQAKMNPAGAHRGSCLNVNRHHRPARTCSSRPPGAPRLLP